MDHTQSFKVTEDALESMLVVAQNAMNRSEADREMYPRTFARCSDVACVCLYV